MSAGSSPADRSPAVVAAAALGAVLAALGLWFLVVSPLLEGADTVEDPTAQPTSPAPSPGGTGDPDDGPAAAPPAGVPVVTYEVFLSRDPFQPVVAPAAGGAEGGGSGAAPDDSSGGTGGEPDPGSGDPPGSGSPGGSDGGTDDGGGDGGDDGSDGGGTDDDGSGDDGAARACPPESTGEAVCDGIVVELRTVSEDAGGPFVVVDLTHAGGSPVTYSGLRAGDRFGPQASDGQEQFSVLHVFVEAGCAQLSYVDEEFQICTGDRILK